MKTTIQLVILLALLAGGGYYGYQQYQAAYVRKASLVAKASNEKQTQDSAKKKAADDAMRQEIGAALKPLRVSSILPGQPGMVIIDKQEYAEGDQLSLPKGRKVRITKVQEDGVLLAYNDLSFRLDPPAAPELASGRKPR